MEKYRSIHVLIVDSDAQRAEHLLSVLRKGQHNLYAKQIIYLNDLQGILNKRWDVCLFVQPNKNILATDWLHRLQEEEKDIPTLVLMQEKQRNQQHLLDEGAFAMLPLGDEHLLSKLIEKAIAHGEKKQRRAALQCELNDYEQLCDELLQSSFDAYAFVHKNKILMANPAFIRLHGFADLSSALRANWQDLYRFKNQSFTAISQQFKHSIRRTVSHDCYARHLRNGEVGLKLTLSKQFYSGKECIKLHVPPEHVTIDRSLNQDLLTGLYNRQALLNSLNTAISQTKIEGENAGFLYLHLQDYQTIKQQHGQPSADLVFDELCQQIQPLFDEQQVLFARYDDDVLCILLRHATREDMSLLAANCQEKSAQHNFLLGDESLKCPCLIGMSLITQVLDSAEEVVTRAKAAALHALKTSEHIAFYAVDMEYDIQSIDDSLLKLVEQAIDEGSFKLIYQPIVGLHGKAYEYYEVLVRVEDTKGNFLTPGDFFPTASQAKLMNQIDRWIIMHATRILAEQRKQGKKTYFFVMLSGESLADRALLEWISQAFKAASLPTDAIIFEMKEIDVSTHMQSAKHFIQGLKMLHCKSAISHFGSGLRSLQTLSEVPVDFVKLDGYFTQKLQGNETESREVLEEMIRTIHAQGKLAIVPMVEQANIMPALWQSGANYVQGYFVSPPSNELNYHSDDEEDKE